VDRHLGEVCFLPLFLVGLPVITDFSDFEGLEILDIIKNSWAEGQFVKEKSQDDLRNRLIC
jgi:hypothetical protein